MIKLNQIFLSKKRRRKFKLFKFFKERLKNKMFCNARFIYNTKIKQKKKTRKFFKRRLRKEIKKNYKFFRQKRNYR